MRRWMMLKALLYNPTFPFLKLLNVRSETVVSTLFPLSSRSIMSGRTSQRLLSSKSRSCRLWCCGVEELEEVTSGSAASRWMDQVWRPPIWSTLCVPRLFRPPGWVSIWSTVCCHQRSREDPILSCPFHPLADILWYHEDSVGLPRPRPSGWRESLILSVVEVVLMLLSVEVLRSLRSQSFSSSIPPFSGPLHLC